MGEGSTSGESPSKRSRQSSPLRKSEIAPWKLLFRGSPFQMDEYNRRWRKIEGDCFRHSYSDAYRIYPGKHPTIKETRHILVSGKPHKTSNEISHGIPWVGVCGADTICVVYMEDKQRIERICNFIGQTLSMTYFWMYLLSEMEYLAHSSIDSEELVGKPFAVVSVNSFTNDDEESFHKDKAISFLQDKLKTNSSIAYDETIQMAIDAFQKLFGREVKAKEIDVMIFEVRGGITRPLTNVEVRKHLNAINHPQSGDIPLSEDDDDLNCVLVEVSSSEDD